MKKRAYVNNRDFYDAIVAHREKVEAHRASGKDTPVPQIPDYIGMCFMQIARKLASRPNFANYTYRDEMIDDGIENCIIGYWTFDPARSKSPFSYFTQTIWFAFLRRIDKEKKQSYIKHMSLVNMSIEMNLAGSAESVTIDDEKAASIVAKFEKKAKPAKAAKGVEKFVD